ncbi:hypothetical protein [Desulforamulus aeronauticus]|uniref:Uncharacterized protein n=1 Tax=Desulforamulus aeronauticus DSM 10349 TaxID=1121421 RepID=A0A1M6UEE8_9FIRM|nr:hypothetical protein [Desulforamulus aeronauticus]SHK67584.1 hypothetical protein SAMN02745123_02707 [Desulforamulus aeronauticus DSM 10349]
MFTVVVQQIPTIVVAAVSFVIWMWLALKIMHQIPVITSKLGLGEAPGLIVAVMALWPLFALTYELFRFFLPS